MTQESPRLAQLRRRVQADPASIAFAQLAEEYRRAGHYQEAVKYCRTGLARHPSYLSARVTLGRALMELGELDDAIREFELVLRSAPDNFVAVRAMAEILHRRGALESALDYYKRALALARFDPDLEEAVQRIGRDIGRVNASTSHEGLSFEEVTSQLMSAASRLPAATPDVPPELPPLAASGIDPSVQIAHGKDPLEAQPVEAPAQAHASASAPAEPLVDFDALLASLGVPGAAPPPITEALLSGGSATVRPEPTAPQPSSDVDATDPFAALEQELRAFDEMATQQAAVPQTPGGAPATASSEADPDAQARRLEEDVADELERWLRVLNAERLSPPNA